MGEFPKLSFRCPMRWESLAGDDKRRFCGHCQKHVTNLSAMTRAERLAFLEAPRTESPCVSYIEPASTALPGLVGAFTASLALLAGCSKQGESQDSGETASVELANRAKILVYESSTMGRVAKAPGVEVPETVVGLPCIPAPREVEPPHVSWMGAPIPAKMADPKIVVPPPIAQPPTAAHIIFRSPGELSSTPQSEGATLDKTNP